MVNITLNVKLNAPTTNGKVEEKLKAVKEKKKVESIEEGFERVLNSKISDKERVKIIKTEDYLKRGLIVRESVRRLSKKEVMEVLYPQVEVLERDQKLADLLASKPSNYVLVNTELEFECMLKLLKGEDVIALDTETTGLDVVCGTTKMVGFSLSLPNIDHHYYVPFGHITNEIQLSEEYVLNGIKPFIEDENLGKVLHNAKYDYHVFKQHNINLKGIVGDTQLIMFLLDENRQDKGLNYRLKDLATQYLKTPSDTFDTLFGGDGEFYKVPLKYACVYACKDTHLTWKLYQLQLQSLEKVPTIKKYYDEVENPLIETVAEMERTGFPVDFNFLDKYIPQYEAEIENLVVQLKEHFGDINFSSPAQLKEVIYNEKKLAKYLPKDLAAKQSTDKETLKKLSEYDIGCKILLEYRDKFKLYNDFFLKLRNMVNEDGKIYSNFSAMGTKTGRFNSTNPNFQQLPKSARKMIVAPENSCILGLDFSGQELRIAASLSQEPNLLDSYNNGLDTYSLIASKVFNVPYEDCLDGSKYRKIAKVVVLASLYGTTPPTLAKQIGCDKEYAEKVLKDFYKANPTLEKWIEDTKKYTLKNGFTYTMKQERKRRLNDVRSSDKYKQQRALRQCVNSVIQGTASVQTKVTMNAIHKAFKTEFREGFKLLASIHDEVLFICPLDITLEEYNRIYNLFTTSYPFNGVESKSDGEFATRWGEGETADEWFGIDN